MNLRCVFLAIPALAAIGWFGALADQPPSPNDQSDDKTQPVDDPTGKGDRLRRPGFLFIELNCRKLADHIAFFDAVAGFKINRQEGNFAILRSARGEILLNEVGGEGKPVRYQGPRVEIGIVVDDVDVAITQAKRHESWEIAAPVARQPWGVRDFRVFSPEGYYLRITEGPK